ncbi:DMT family transporter [Bacillus cereus group sp. BC251]|jgi:paired small multidrug resistance pump|uniref:DMT family transporter n=1 Tax=Bacillus cereus group TaxID=86661 RepID=UPI000C347ED3|nr:multidrug efflux SMR transporter [Bacillus sp. HBCD-sjtu]AUD24403.1 ligand-binding protein SH3 [Bacillus sp. HBCD-sjtu]HDR4389476.1 multidrug efflux SMR transporter [Bacillus cereus]HDR4598109.1 multidrug efflux SMR transporter [Bacillus cereus]HDR4655703.1 multidrug efflux SMR transporter [Bacillus cereus]
MKNKAWLYVILTCIFEVFWVFGFNTANTWWHWVIILGVIAVDFHFLSKACEHLATGTVYAVFAGAGTVGTFLMDVFLFGGSFSVGKLFFIVMVVAGVIGLKLADNKEETVEGAA